MANFDPERMESKRVVASGAFIDQPDYPILFSSPDCSHHDDWVGMIAFFPDGRTLASGSNETAIVLWDVEKKEESARLLGHTGAVLCMRFSPDGRTLALSFADGAVRLWDVSSSFNLKGEKAIEEIFYEAEIKYNLRLVDLALQPIVPERNLYGVTSQAPEWPETHPFHWLRKAGNGDAEAMVELGIVYDRCNELEKARYWYDQAIQAGSDQGRQRMKIFKKWLALHKE